MGFQGRDVVYYLGPNGDKVVYGDRGIVVRSWPERCEVRFDQNRNTHMVRVEALSRTSPGPRPAAHGFQVNEDVYYVGFISTTEPNGDTRMYGSKGIVVGLVPERHTELLVKFIQNKESLACHVINLSKTLPQPRSEVAAKMVVEALPSRADIGAALRWGGTKLKDALCAAASLADSQEASPPEYEELRAEVAQKTRQVQDLERKLSELSEAAVQSRADLWQLEAQRTQQVQDLERRLSEAQANLQQLAVNQDQAIGHLQASCLPQLSRSVTYGLHEIPLTSPLAKYLSNLFTFTAASHRIQLGHPGFAPAPRLRVTRIERILNARLYDKYMSEVQDLQGLFRGRGCDPFNAFPHLRVDAASLPPGQVDLNECFAFHGATDDVVTNICKAGFDPRRGGEVAGKLFGVGSYFAVNSSKSDIYTDLNDRQPRGSERKIIVARLAMGRVYRVEHGCSHLTRPPDEYDSIWADARSNGGCVDHPELIIFKEAQALPQFVITYVHECPTSELCSECSKRPQ